MKIIFEEMLESDYFRMLFLTDKKGQDNSQNIIIGKENQKTKNNSPNISHTNLIKFERPLTITVHQQKNGLMEENKKNIVNLVRLIHERNNDAQIKIQIISDHFNYYYKEFYSAIYNDNALFNNSRINVRKVALSILLKKYFGYKLAHVISVFYTKLRRLIRF